MDITPAQAGKLRDAVRNRMSYFHAVKVRMYQLNVGPGDRLYDLFDQAEAALRRLAEELHNLSLGPGRRYLEPGA
jgi:hypothetical protein